MNNDKNNEWIETGQSGDMWDGQGEVIGVFSRKRTGVGPNESNTYHLKKDDGTEVGIWGSTVLDNKFQEIPLGCKVRIQSLGLSTGKRGTKYKDYKVQYQYNEAAKQLIQPDNEYVDNDLPPIENYEDLGL